MVTIARLAETAALIGDPARTAMLYAMMDGRAFTAGELASAAGVTPQTASGHLAQLLGADMLVADKQGRHRYFRLASADISAILEGLMTVTAARSPLTTGPADPALRGARICYDHIAGALGVALYAALLERGHVRLAEDGVALTESGRALLGSLGIAPPPARRPPAARPPPGLPDVPRLERTPPPPRRPGRRRDLCCSVGPRLASPPRGYAGAGGYAKGRRGVS